MGSTFRAAAAVSSAATFTTSHGAPIKRGRSRRHPGRRAYRIDCPRSARRCGLRGAESRSSAMGWSRLLHSRNRQIRPRSSRTPSLGPWCDDSRGRQSCRMFAEHDQASAFRLAVDHHLRPGDVRGPGVVTVETDIVFVLEQWRSSWSWIASLTSGDLRGLLSLRSETADEGEMIPESLRFRRVGRERGDVTLSGKRHSDRRLPRLPANQLRPHPRPAAPPARLGDGIAPPTGRAWRGCGERPNFGPSPAHGRTMCAILTRNVMRYGLQT